MLMKEKTNRPDREENPLDILLGVKRFPKPLRPMGRLPQLNKHFKTIARLHAQSA